VHKMITREKAEEYLGERDGFLYEYAQRRVITDLLFDIRDLLVAQQKAIKPICPKCGLPIFVRLPVVPNCSGHEGEEG
jgi:hypothetical protein